MDAKVKDGYQPIRHRTFETAKPKSGHSEGLRKWEK
jgi:hypothetical protein